MTGFGLYLTFLVAGALIFFIVNRRDRAEWILFGIGFWILFWTGVALWTGVLR